MELILAWGLPGFRGPRQEFIDAANWSIRSNLQAGNQTYGDRTDVTFGTVPPAYAGLDWIRTASNSRGYSGATLASFKVNYNAEVYVAHNDRITTKPSWLSGWTDTGDHMVWGETYSVYKKTFTGGSTVTLGPNGNGSIGMYSVTVKKQ